MREKSSVLVDGRNISLHNGTGIATYARNLFDPLTKLGLSTQILFGENIKFYRESPVREMQFFNVLTQRPRRLSLLKSALASNFHVNLSEIKFGDVVIKTPFRDRIPLAERIWNSRNIYDYAIWKFKTFGKFTEIPNTMGAAYAHWTYPVPIRLRGAKNIYTIHDLIPMRLPYATLDHKPSFYRMIQAICRTADKIVTVSEFSKRDIQTYFDIAGEKVINTHQSVSIPDKLLTADRQTLECSLKGLFDLTYKNYILFVGAVEPKKNIGRLIEAYLTTDLDMPLVIAGPDGWLIENELRLFHEHRSIRASRRMPPRIRRLDYVPFAQLISLMRGAKMIAFPSLYEGFGLPIIEGMICGTPVMSSTTGSSKEIAGDAALFVDPYDVRSIREGLIALCTDPELANGLVVLGRKNVLRFSQESYIERLKEVYAT